MLTICCSQSMHKIQVMVSNNNVALQNISDQSRRMWRRQHATAPEPQSLRDTESILTCDQCSDVSDRQFDFDDEVVNSVSYRRILAQMNVAQRTRKLSAKNTDAPNDTSDASIKEITKVVEAEQDASIRTVTESSSEERNGTGIQGLPQSPVDGMLSRAPVDLNSIADIPTAIANHDIVAVTQRLDNGVDVNQTYKLGRTALHLCARHGALDISRILITRGAHIDARSSNDTYKRTPLMSACERDSPASPAMAKALLDSGASLHARDDRGWSPIHYAAAFGGVSLLEFLVQRGASLNEITDNSSKQCSVLHIACRHSKKPQVIDYLLKTLDDGAIEETGKCVHTPLSHAMEGGKMDIIDFLLGKDARVNYNVIWGAARSKKLPVLNRVVTTWGDMVRSNYIDEQGRTIATECARVGWLAGLKTVVDAGANLNIYNSKYLSAADHAASNADLPMLQYMLDEGVRFSPSSSGQDAIVMLCDSPRFSTEALDFLLRNGASLDVVCGGMTSLMALIDNGREGAVRLLLKHGANITQADAGGITALHAAAALDRPQILEILLENMISQLDIEDDSGRTPLMYAVAGGANRAIRYLLSKGASITARTIPEHYTPFHVACFSGNVEAMALLLEHGSDVHATDRDGDGCLTMAIESNKPEVIQFLGKNHRSLMTYRENGRTPLLLYLERAKPKRRKRNIVSIIRTLLELGADIDATGKVDSRRPDTPLGFAARLGLVKEMEVLLDLGADFRKSAYRSRTPFILACISGQSRVVQLWLNDRRTQGQVNDRDEDGCTGLHYAVHYKFTKIVKLLLGSNLIDVNIQDKDGRTAKDYSRGDPDLYQMIKEAIGSRNLSDTGRKRVVPRGNARKN